MGTRWASFALEFPGVHEGSWCGEENERAGTEQRQEKKYKELLGVTLSDCLRWH